METIVESTREINDAFRKINDAYGPYDSRTFGKKFLGLEE